MVRLCGVWGERLQREQEDALDAPGQQPLKRVPRRQRRGLIRDR
jgi:hypothetical protein